jgi:S-DNA-T family DNA segregation ATPase FtsK/SpoIIIE
VASVLLQESAGLALLGLALLAAIALATHDPADPVFTAGPVQNAAGALGAALSAVLRRSLGLASFLLAGAVAVVGARLTAGRGLPRLASRFWVGAGLLGIAAATLPPILGRLLPGSFGDADGGFLGNRLAGAESWLLGAWGALLLNAVLLSIGSLVATGFSLGRALAAFGMVIGWLLAGLAAVAWRAVAVASEALVSAFEALRDLARGVERGWRSLSVRREQRARRARVAAARPPEADEPEPEAPSEEPTLAPPRRGRRAEPQIVEHRSAGGGDAAARQEAFRFEDRGPSGPFQLPDTKIFQEPKASRTFDRDSLIMNSRILEKKLADFGVGGSVVTVHPGPVITMYEFEPASGIKVNKIVGLSDDLALALRALSVRIIAPLPGKSVVGIEVANPERETVYLRDLLECERFRASRSLLPVALGKDIFGNPVDADLAKMPHLLVAGATGTGKSVFLNALLCSILCRKTPEELKLLLVDPKLLELSVYAGIPHLVADVVTNPKRASAALAGVVRKMEERYQMMAALGVRSIQQFNERCERELEAGNTHFRLKAKPDEEQGEEIAYEKLPFIVVVIDELADLMVVCAKDVEESLQRLAQMARAAGIHLVLATQRPSVDVLTGVIKANFPARISFQVSSRTDSRTILDQNGADHLLGSGDMLFLPPGTSKMQRLHGAFVTEDEVTRSSPPSSPIRKRVAPAARTSTRCTTTRCRSWRRRATPPSPTSRGGSRSGTTAPPAWWSRWRPKASSARRSARSPARSSSARSSLEFPERRRVEDRHGWTSRGDPQGGTPAGAAPGAAPGGGRGRAPGSRCGGDASRRAGRLPRPHRGRDPGPLRERARLRGALRADHPGRPDRRWRRRVGDLARTRRGGQAGAHALVLRDPGALGGGERRRDALDLRSRLPRGPAPARGPGLPVGRGGAVPARAGRHAPRVRDLAGGRLRGGSRGARAGAARAGLLREAARGGAPDHRRPAPHRGPRPARQRDRGGLQPARVQPRSAGGHLPLRAAGGGHGRRPVRGPAPCALKLPKHGTFLPRIAGCRRVRRGPPETPTPGVKKSATPRQAGGNPAM